jgi:hypothetical protein
MARIAAAANAQSRPYPEFFSGRAPRLPRCPEGFPSKIPVVVGLLFLRPIPMDSRRFSPPAAWVRAPRQVRCLRVPRWSFPPYPGRRPTTTPQARTHGRRLHWFPVLPPRTAVALLRCPSGCRPGRRLVTSQSHAGTAAPLSLSNLSRQRWRVVDGVAKDKISKLLGLSTLQGSKHNTARDRPWYAQGSCLCDGIPFSFANIVQTLVC